MGSEHACWDALSRYQQADEDGVMVLVSRQAVDECIAAWNARPTPRVEEWQPIATAPKDGTKIDLWVICHLHPTKRGRRVFDAEWGRVRDWLGTERDDWIGASAEDDEPTHWMPRPAPPGSAISTTHHDVRAETIEKAWCDALELAARCAERRIEAGRPETIPGSLRALAGEGK